MYLLHTKFEYTRIEIFRLLFDKSMRNYGRYHKEIKIIDFTYLFEVIFQILMINF